MSVTEELLEFAYCPFQRYESLSHLAVEENWGPDNRILRNYCVFTFKRAAQLFNRDERNGHEHRSLLIEDGAYACFDTGLYTARYECIYAYFEPNSNASARQAWFLKGFYKTSDPALSHLDDLPARVRYTDSPADLIYDFNLRIRVNIDHILGDAENLSRIPPMLQGEQNSLLLHRVFEGAVAEAERRATANYMLAVPQYYNGRIQLLLPLCLTGDKPELALAIQREDGYYAARTCLTIEMAYNNARLINKPEASWICPVA